MGASCGVAAGCALMEAASASLRSTSYLRGDLQEKLRVPTRSDDGHAG